MVTCKTPSQSNHQYRLERYSPGHIFLLRSNWLLKAAERRTIILLEGVTLVGFSCSLDVCTKIKRKTENWEGHVGGNYKGNSGAYLIVFHHMHV